jgi:hypothetical protein
VDGSLSGAYGTDFAVYWEPRSGGRGRRKVAFGGIDSWPGGAAFVQMPIYRLTAAGISSTVEDQNRFWSSFVMFLAWACRYSVDFLLRFLTLVRLPLNLVLCLFANFVQHLGRSAAAGGNFLASQAEINDRF